MLTSADLEMFARLRIPGEIIALAGIERVTDVEAREKYGIMGAGDMAGIAFPYWNPATLANGERRRNYVRVRRDRPEIEDGKPQKKYVAPYGDRKHLYFPPAPELFADVSVPIVLAEAEKSALALLAWAERTGRKLLPIGLGGCWGWRGRVGKVDTADGQRVDEVGALPDLNICRDSRVTYILLDSNCATNPKVQHARAALCRQLRKQRAAVRVLDLPPGDGVNGPDDLLAIRGDQAMVEIIDGWIDGAKLLDDLVTYYRKYVRVGEDEYSVLASWVLHCHAFSAFSRTPYLNVTSPAPDCGKTQLLEVSELLVVNPMMASSSTAAVLSRCINDDRPVLMVDEFDQLMSGDKELLAAVLATVNSGYKASGCRYILEPTKGGGWHKKKLSTYCPKILAGISSLPPSTKTRCVPINMERLAPGDSVEDPDEYVIEPEAQKLKTAAAGWAQQHLAELAVARPDSPPALRNRQREVSRPLFAVADAIGGTWPERVRCAVVRLFATRDAAPADDIKMELLADIKEVFGDKEKMASAELVQALANMDERPWATWGKNDKPINTNQLARLLKDFKVRPQTVREEKDTFKGYKREWFQPIWTRYLPHADAQPVTPSQPAPIADETLFSNRHNEADVTDEKRENPAPVEGCDGVTDGKPVWGVGQEEADPPAGNGKAAVPDVSDCHPADMRLVQLRLDRGLPVKAELLEKFGRWRAAGKVAAPSC
jgi:hypothetical protein